MFATTLLILAAGLLVSLVWPVLRRGPDGPSWGPGAALPMTPRSWHRSGLGDW